MATRSSISIRLDGVIESIYCHNDGYPSHNGRLLLNYYNSEKDASNIVALGGLSTLGVSLDNSTVNEDFNVTLPYTERGEELTIHSLSEEKYLNSFVDNFEYNYIWENGNWYVDGKLLTEEIIEND